MLKVTMCQSQLIKIVIYYHHQSPIPLVLSLIDLYCHQLGHLPNELSVSECEMVLSATLFNNTKNHFIVNPQNRTYGQVNAKGFYLLLYSISDRTLLLSHLDGILLLVNCHCLDCCLSGWQTIYLLNLISFH